MATYYIKAEVVVTYMYEVQADSHEAACRLVEDDASVDGAEIDSTAPTPVQWARQGQAGWLAVAEAEAEADAE